MESPVQEVQRLVGENDVAVLALPQVGHVVVVLGGSGFSVIYVVRSYDGNGGCRLGPLLHVDGMNLNSRGGRSLVVIYAIDAAYVGD